MTASAIVELARADPDQLLSPEQAAALLGISRRTFDRIAWFKPRKVRPTDSRARNATVRYRRGDVALYKSLCASRPQPRRAR